MSHIFCIHIRVFVASLLLLICGVGAANAQFRGGHWPAAAFARRQAANTPPISMATRGAFFPSTGLFVPSANGPYSLISRNGFEPLRGTFSPNPAGSFLLLTRESFNPRTGTL